MNLLIAFVLGVLTAGKIVKRPYNADHRNSKANQQSNSSSLTPLATSQTSPSASHRTPASNRKKWWPQTLKDWAEVLGLIVLILYTGFTYRIMRANLIAAQAANDTLGEVRKQTSLMRQQLVGSQEAVLYFAVGYNPDGGPELTAQLQNKGHVTAAAIHLKIDASQQRLRDGSIIGAPFHFEPVVAPIESGGNFSRNWNMPWQLTEKERQQGGTFAPDWPGNRTFVIRAEVTFQNGFGEERHQEICKQWLPGWSVKDRFGRTFAGGGFTYDCSDIKTIIRQTLELARNSQKGQD